MTDGAPVDLEALLAHSDWARKLALHLVRDPDRADDLVQETWRKALERPPAEDSTPAGLRGWIGTVLRNLAGTRRRDADLRAWHERRAARPESWTPEDIEQRVLLQRRLAEAVLELAEPYRTAITLRYFVGLSTREVARRQGVSHDAARQRISRGLAMLHRRLDQEFRGGEVAWSVIAAALAFEGASEGGLPSIFKGGLLVSSKAKLSAVAVFVAVAAVFVVSRIGNDRSRPAVSSSEPGVIASSTLEASTPAIPSPNATDEGRVEVKQTTLPPEKAVSSIDDRDRVLAGRVIDPSGNPVEGAKIVVFRNERSEYKFLETFHQFDRRAIAETRSDTNGEFAVQLEGGRPFLMETEARGFALQRLEHRYAGERVLVRLYRGATIQGFVSRKSDHSAVVDAAIRGYAGTKQGPRDRYYAFEGKTDALGRFEFSGLAPGEVYLRIIPEVDVESEMKRLELIEGSICEINVEVDAGQTLRGRVVDAVSGQPIPGAEVGVGRDLQRPVRTDANGEYVYPGFAFISALDLDARATGYGKVENFLRTSAEDPLPDRVDFELTPARLARGRVVDAQGNPVGAAYVIAVSYSRREPGKDKVDWRSSTSSTDGTFRIEDLRPDLAHAFLARKDGLGTVLYDFPADEATRKEIDLGDVVLPPMSILRGSVVDDSGSGIPDQTVSLRGWNSDRSRFREVGGRRIPPHAEMGAAEIYLGIREARTDDSGRFCFADVAGGTYTVSTERRGGTPVSRQVAIENGATKDGIRLVQPEGKSIEGRVVTYAGTPVSRALVWGRPEDSTVPGGSSAETDAEGRFALRGLGTTTYWLNAQASYWSKDSTNATDLAPTEMSGVNPGARGIEIVLARTVPIRGRVIDSTGRGLARAKIRFGATGGELRRIAETGEDGSFSISVGAGVVLDLEALSGDTDRPSVIPSYPASDTEHVARMSRVMAGTVDIVFTLARYP